MALTDAPSRLLPLAEELLDNRYARENLREGAEKLRDAYGRTRKRRVKPSNGRKVVLTVLTVTGAAAAAALALNEDLRESVLGSAKALGEEVTSGPASDSGSAGSVS